MSNVFIALQTNDESRGIVDAIMADNPTAVLNEQPAMVKIDAPGKLVIRRQSIADRLGRDFDLQEMQIHLITLSGFLDETDDEFTLRWNA